MCGKKFSTQSVLIKHRRNVHEKQKNYVCNLCNKAFSENSDLKKHHCQDQISRVTFATRNLENGAYFSSRTFAKQSTKI